MPVRVVQVTGPGRGEGASGRARQLQAGLQGTRGETVLFLHADTRLPEGWPAAVEAALARPGVSGGAFRFAFGEPGRPLGSLERVALRIVERGARWRGALFGLPYGDQALFARRKTLEAIGGIPQVALMEDLDLVQALKKRGRLALLALDAPTSPRRHLEGGVLRTAARHVLAALAWSAGVDRRRLAAWLAR